MNSMLSPCDSTLQRAVVCAFALALSTLSSNSSVGRAFAQTDVPASDAPTAEPLVEILQPKRQRSETEEDRITASAWYTRARLLHQRGKKAAALRAYQRAWRYDPQAATILNEIVPLAFELKRGDEAARYAVFAAEADPEDAILVRRLALYLADDRKWDRAVRLYERSLELQPAMNQVTDLSSAVLHQEMGRLYFLSDQFEKSASSFAKVRDAIAAASSSLDKQAQQIVLGDDAADTYALWAESFLAAKRYDEALTLFERAHHLQPDAGRFALQRARVESARGETAKAIERLNEHFAASSNDSSALEPFELLAALLQKQHSDEQQARAALIEHLQKLHNERSDDVALSYYLAQQWIAVDRLDEAEKLLVEALAIKPASEGYRQLVSLYHKRRNASKLAKLLGEVVQKTGSLQTLESELVAIAADAQLVTELLAATRDQLRDGPNALGNRQLFAAGMVALAAEQWDAAGEMFEAQILAHSTTKNDALLTWGFGLYLADEYERAIPVFRRAIDEKAVGDNAAAVHLSLASALELSGKTDEAIAAVDKAISADTQSAAAVSRKGWILYHAKRYDDATKTYQGLIAAHDAGHGSPLLRETIRDARLALSSILLAQDKFAEAVEMLEQVLDEYPEDAGALNDLGYLWAERGLHKERALVMTKKAVAAEPDNTSYRDSLGWAFYQLSRYDEAVRELEQAASGDGSGGIVLEHLGDAYDKVGQPVKARAAWENAAKAYQSEQELGKTEALRKKLTQRPPGASAN